MILVQLRVSGPTEDLSGTGASHAGIVEEGAYRWSVWYWQTKVDTLPDDRLLAQFGHEYFYAECFVGGEKYVFRCRDGNDLFVAFPLIQSDLKDRIVKARALAIDLEDLPF
jgi:hypothetical protein